MCGLCDVLKVLLVGSFKSCPMPCLQEDPLVGLDFGELNITSQDDDILDEAAGECGTLSSEEEVVCRISSSPLPLSQPSPPPSHAHIQGHIQENLEDELVQEALRKVCFVPQVTYKMFTYIGHSSFSPQGLDLRQYSRQIESELRKVEVRSIEDCILQFTRRFTEWVTERCTERFTERFTGRFTERFTEWVTGDLLKYSDLADGNGDFLTMF